MREPTLGLVYNSVGEHIVDGINREPVGRCFLGIYTHQLERFMEGSLEVKQTSDNMDR